MFLAFCASYRYYIREELLLKFKMWYSAKSFIENSGKWEAIDGSDGNLSQLTIAEDPEEIFVVSGHLYDEAFSMWLEPGYYASRPPGEIHGSRINDAGIAAICLSHGVEELWSADRDFSRFPGLNVRTHWFRQVPFKIPTWCPSSPYL